MAAETPAARLTRRLVPSTGRRPQAVDLLWSSFAGLMLILMFLMPDEQTIPYHLLYVSFTLLYGFRLWSVPVTATALAVLTAVPGLLYLHLYQVGRVEGSELAEIPLMSLIVGGMAWHAHRSASARQVAEQLAALEESSGRRQRAFLGDTAHAIRTPITIGRGHLELVQAQALEPQVRADLDEVLHQLDRLQGMARRLLMIEALATTERPVPVVADVATLVSDVARHWSRAAHRDWVVDVPVAQARCGVDTSRLEEALDAVVENALRFTRPGDRVRISCRATAAWVSIEVADSGPGVPVEDRERVFDRFFHRHPPGEEPGTGLGLALVAAVAEAFGGAVSADDAPEGGLLLTLRLPADR